MTGVFYYANSNLMLQVKYSQETDTLLYSSHRKITDSERSFVEENIPNNVHVESRTATFYYLGINHKLTQIFSLLSLVKPFESDVQLSEQSLESMVRKIENSNHELSANFPFQQSCN